VKEREIIKNSLRNAYGDFGTYLEHEYEDFIIKVLLKSDLNEKKKWMTYNQVVIELKHNLKDMLKVKELQYKLTENIDPVGVCIEVLDSLKLKTPELERLYNKINNFK
jgi:hypothetical protein